MFGRWDQKIRQSSLTRSIKFVEIANFTLGIYLLTSAKAYPTVDPRNARLVMALGDVCGATERLPTSAMLSAGLEKCGNIAVASGGFTDIWRGEYYTAPVAIKAFRIYPAQNLKEAKEVSMSI